MSSAALIFTPDNSGEAPTKYDVVNVTFKALFFLFMVQHTYKIQLSWCYFLFTLQRMGIILVNNHSLSSQWHASWQWDICVNFNSSKIFHPNLSRGEQLCHLFHQKEIVNTQHTNFWVERQILKASCSVSKAHGLLRLVLALARAQALLWLLLCNSE
jgi:hypothetical protein